MDPLTRLMLRLTPEERAEVAREVAERIGSLDDEAIEQAWLDALQRRFGEPATQTELPLFSGDTGDRHPHG